MSIIYNFKDHILGFKMTMKHFMVPWAYMGGLWFLCLGVPYKITHVQKAQNNHQLQGPYHFLFIVHL